MGGAAVDFLNAHPDPLDDWDALPLSHARIGYENLLTAASTADAAKALQPNTYERWTSASGTMEATFQPSAAVGVDFVAIGAHNLGSAGASVKIATAPTVAGTFTDREYLTPSDDGAIMFLIDLTEVADIKVTVTGGADREIGVIYAGQALQMQRPFYGGHTPSDMAARTEYNTNYSESGQFLGRSIIRQGSTPSYQFQHLAPDWVRERFMPFVRSARTRPFFLRWRPDEYAATVFGYTTDDIKPQNMGGGHALMSVGFSMRGHADV